jgi:L-aminopeptidase/D-esterase-like protein
MLTDVPGVLVGHYTDAVGATGCTVVLLPEGNVASGEVRGGAPGTREFELLDPTRVVSGIDAVLLSGGSAFGLAAADGVVRWCEEHGRGYVTKHARVPIVVGAVIYDLGVGSSLARPTDANGYDACVRAATGSFDVGRVGAGTGATRSKWRGDDIVYGGIGTATVRSADVIVSALMVVNSIGDIVSDGGIDPADVDSMVPTMQARGDAYRAAMENTTIGVVLTNAVLDKTACHLLAQSGHDGVARAIWPAHLSGDGDAIVAVSCPGSDGVVAPVDAVRALATEAVAQAIRSLL